MVWAGTLPSFQVFSGYLYAIRSPQHSSRLLGEKVPNAQKQGSRIVLVCGRKGFTFQRGRCILTKKQALGNTSPFDFREPQGASVDGCQSVLAGGAKR